ncbi:MAG: beta-1,3-glucanase family protein [Bacteroidota bacterium]
MDLTISNNSGQKAYFVLWGCTNLANTEALKRSARWCYYKLSGTTGDNVTATITDFPNPGSDVGDSINWVPNLYTLEAGESFTIKDAPYLYSGNATFSFGAPPKLFALVPSWSDITTKTLSPYFGSMGIQSPGFMPTDADADTIFASCEFTYQPEGVSDAVWADTTNVDYFCVPISITVDYGDNQSVSTGDMQSGKGRDDVFNAFTGLSSDATYSDFAKLVRTSGGSNIRIYAPGHGITNGTFPSDYFDAYIDEVYSYYDGSTDAKKLTVTVEGAFAGTYVGWVNDQGQFNFDGVGSFAKPTSQQAFLCAGGPFPEGNSKLAAVGARLGAAINRHVLEAHNQQPYCTTSDFYASAPNNYYSKLLHDNLSKVYGFAYDDVCSDSSSPLLHVTEPTSVTIDLASWTAS